MCIARAINLETKPINAVTTGFKLLRKTLVVYFCFSSRIDRLPPLLSISLVLWAHLSVSISPITLLSLAIDENPQERLQAPGLSDSLLIGAFSTSL